MVDVVSNFAVPVSTPDLGRQASLLAHAHVASLALALGRAQAAGSPNASLRAHVESRARASTGAARLWAPEIGVIRSFFRAADIEGALTQLALHLTDLGEQEPWTVTLDGPRAFLFAGHILRLDGKVEVAPQGDLLVFRDARGTNRFRLGAGVWTAETDVLRVASTIPTPRTLGFDAPKYVIALRRDPNVVDGEEIDQADLFGTIDPTGRPLSDYAAGQLQKGFELVDSAMPSFSDYLRILLRGVAAIPAGSGANGQSSGSSSEYPGIFTCTFPGGGDWLAETLVHECSHQYLNLLHSVFPLTTKDDGQRYFSSIKNDKRTLQRQIIGYHAVANITLFRRALVEYADSPHRRQELAKFEAFAQEMRPEIDRGTTFTEEGRTFVDVLNARLDEGGATMPADIRVSAA